MKNIKVILIIFLSSISIYGQIPKLGNIFNQDIFMKSYAKDSTAGALILEEFCEVFPSKHKKYYFKKNYYVKIKFFNNNNFDKATIEIPYSKLSKLENIGGVTYNLDENGNTIKSELDINKIINRNYNTSVKGKSFVLPNVKKGSVIEYKYSIHTNSYGVYDWYFQTDIPKVKTSYQAYFSSDNFKVRTIGYLRPQNLGDSKCLKGKLCNLSYKLDNVPAFKEEAFLSNKDNYISRLSFEKAYIFDPYIKKGQNREWKTIDKAIKNRYDDDLDKTSFYKRKLPDSILNEPNELIRAKKVYYFIQSHFTLDTNTDQYLFQAYKNKKGTIKQINLSLYYALKAAKVGIPNLVMSSTRANGFATKLHATVIDFNYRLVLLNLEGKKYFLDATNKLLPFGLIPSFCLNGDGRIFNPNRPSFWEPMVSNIIPSTQKTIIRAKLNTIENSFDTRLKIISNGYYAYKKRKQLSLPKSDKIITGKMEEKYPYLEIDKSEFNNRTDKEKPIQEIHTLTIEDAISEGKYIKIANLMIGSSSIENPFKLQNRKYPVDFGYPNEESFRISIALPENIEVVAIPKSEGFKLPNNDAFYLFKADIKNNILSINFQYNINKKVFLNDQYQLLKSFYSKMTKVQNSLIELKFKN